MKLGIICAMEEELAEILLQLPLELIGKMERAGNHYFEYTYLGAMEHSIIVVVSGIGKVNAALATQILLDSYPVSALINVGVAGSLSSDLGFGDVVIATDLVEHDFDITAFGVPLGQIARMDTFSFAAASQLNHLLSGAQAVLPHNRLVYGRIISGDQFIDDGAKAQLLQQQFKALACEMEGAAIAHVCYLNHIPFAVIRSLSDMAGQVGAAIYSFNDLKVMAAQRAAAVVGYLLTQL